MGVAREVDVKEADREQARILARHLPGLTCRAARRRFVREHAPVLAAMRAREEATASALSAVCAEDMSMTFGAQHIVAGTTYRATMDESGALLLWPDGRPLVDVDVEAHDGTDSPQTP